jgi:hypothetical protein
MRLARREKASTAVICPLIQSRRMDQTAVWPSCKARRS